MSVSSSSESIPSSTAQSAGYALSQLVTPASLSHLTELRIAARKKNGHVIDGTKDGLAALEIEHDRMSSLLSSAADKADAWLAGGKSNDALAKECDELTDQALALISSHASTEERYVYPLFATHLKGTVQGITASNIYERNVADDDANKVYLDLLRKMKLKNDGELMAATIRKFQTIEEEHLCQEEHWFALLRSQMTPSSLQTLATVIATAEPFAPTRPHPLGPSHAVMANIMHPIVGLADHALDKITGRTNVEAGKDARAPAQQHEGDKSISH